MAPQRRSQRQQARQASTTDLLQTDTSPDSTPVADQQDTGAEVPAKVPRRRNNSPRGAAQDQQQQQQQHQQQQTALLTQMEMERAARIAANQARLAQLELPQLAAELAASAAAAATAHKKASAVSQRGVSSKRSRVDQQLPQRHSARKRGEAPDPVTAGGIDYEARDGRVVLATFVPERYNSSSGGVGESAAAAVAKPPPGPLPFSSSNGDEASDAAFLQQLRAFAASSGAAVDDKQPSSSSAGCVFGAERLMQLQLRAVDVAKLTTQGVSCLAFHPSSSRPIIAAADKSGKVGLWDVDHPAVAVGDSSGYDGVLMFEPHLDYVSSMRWLGPTGDALLTGSYDGVVRRLDVETGVWALVDGVPSDAEHNNWSAGDATPDGSTIFLATSEGQLTILDTRSSSGAGPQLNIANRKVNTLQLHQDQVHLLSSASDGTVAVWDVRQLEGSSCSSRHNNMCKPLAAAKHYKSSQGAYWDPTGVKRVLSVSFDDTLRIWSLSASSLEPQVVMKHNNNTGRWVMPFRPAWAPSGDAVCVGDLKRGVAVFSSSGAAVGMLTAEALTAIPSRLAMHPTGLLAAATSSGRVHIFR